MKIVPIKMDEKEYQLFKEARTQAIIEEKRIGTWLAKAILDALEKQPQE